MMERFRARTNGRASAFVAAVRATLLGAHGLVTLDRPELVTRCFVLAFAVAPTLFTLIELAPTAWAMAFAVVVILCDFRSFDRAYFARLYGPLALLAAAACLASASGLWSLAPPRSFRTGGVLFSYAVAGFVLIAAARRLSPPQLARIWRALIIGSVPALACLAAYETFVWFFADPERLQFHTITLHKITVYGFLFATALLFPLEDRGDRLRRLLVVLLFAIPTFLFGRTSAITLLIPAGILIYALPTGWRGRALWIFAACYAVLALCGPIIAPALFAHTMKTGVFSLSSALYNAGARLDLWQLMSPHILKAPFFGHGADVVRVSLFLIEGKTLYGGPDIPSAHNIVFDLWFELGLTGVLLLLVAVGLLTRTIASLAPRAQLCAMLMFVCLLVELSVDHRLWLSWVYGTLIFGAVACVLAARIEATKAAPFRSVV